MQNDDINDDIDDRLEQERNPDNIQPLVDPLAEDGDTPDTPIDGLQQDDSAGADPRTDADSDLDSTEVYNQGS